MRFAPEFNIVSRLSYGNVLGNERVIEICIFRFGVFFRVHILLISQ